ncbi:MAG: alpha-L-fucosidase [Bacteroidota bacterium]
MKRFLLMGLLAFFVLNLNAQYVPSKENLEARKAFEAMRYGLFIHWGPFSIPGSGEWVMNNRNIKVKEYSRLKDFFNPTAFDAAAYVTMAKKAGMKYITLITRHHDGFSMWDTKYSDFNIMNTPYKQDIVKLIADECHKQGVKLFLYYSLLDWRRDDYPRETGRTGQGTGRTGKSDYASYLRFMKNQLTELLTNYGKIDGIWFDGHWDQTPPEGEKDRTSRLNWKYDEIYGLIHKLQPWALIGNNHHLSPMPGEDFQMFEKDLPGENKVGLSFQQPSDQLPLETCETMNNSWGFNLTDTKYKSEKQVIHYLVNAAGRNANLLLNVGPMPNGKIQEEFVDTLAATGKWLEKYGETIYGTNGNVIKPQNWGVATQKDKTVYLHVLSDSINGAILLPDFNQKIKNVATFDGNVKLKYQQEADGLHIFVKKEASEIDKIIKLEIQ